MPIIFPVGPISMTGTRLVLIAIIIPITTNLIMGRYGRLLWTDILFFLHAAWIIVALAVNSPEQVIANAGSTLIEFIGGYALGRASIRSADDFTALIRLLATAALFAFPFAIYEALTGKALVLNLLDKLPGIRTLADIEIGKRLGLYRVQFVFAHPIHYGLFCTMAFALCFVGLKDVYGDARRWLISIIVGLGGLLALSSGAFLAIVMQLILLTWAAVFRNVRMRWWLLVGLLAVLYVAIDLFSTRTPLRVFMSYATFSSHTAYWRSIIFDWGMRNVWENPYFGLGLRDWVRPSYMVSGSMDNFWLVLAVRYGIPGFLFCALGYGIALWKILRRDFDADPVLWRLRRAWAFSFIGLTFTLCTVHIWHTIYSFLFFMFGAGIWMLTVPVGDGGAPAKVDRSNSLRPLAPPPPGGTAAGAEQIAPQGGPRFSRFPHHSRHRLGLPQLPEDTKI